MADTLDLLMPRWCHPKLLFAGCIDSDGAISIDESGDPLVDDILDDLGERVLRSGGEVVIVPAERMPTDSGLAAIYRF